MSDFSICDPQQWAGKQWSTTQLGDPRRTRRAVRLGAAIAQQPEAGLPTQTGNWADLKAAYRLLNHPALTHTALCAPHSSQTLLEAQQAEVVLFIQDTSQLDYSSHPATTGLGHIGDTRGRGIMLHTCLAVSPAQPSLLGLAYQKAWVRQHVYKGNETRTQRRERQSESDLWAQTLEALHSPPPGCTWVSVGDRGSDVFSFLRRARELGWHYLVRVCQDRRIFTAAGAEDSLFDWLRAQPAAGSKSLNLRGRDGRPARQVELQVSWSAVEVRPPRLGPERKGEPIQAWCVRGWEAGGGEEALEWMLLTSVALSSLSEALERLEWYSRRWLIEEYHKCVKTGCRMEQRQLKSCEGLLGLLGFVAVVAVRLLQLRELSRSQPEQPAEGLLAQEWIAIVSRQIGCEGSGLNLKQFWRGVAQMGGFLSRKGDGEAGWQSLWSGWRRLMDISWGMSLARDGPTYG